MITVSHINQAYVITDGLSNNYSNVNRRHIFATLYQVVRSRYISRTESHTTSLECPIACYITSQPIPPDFVIIRVFASIAF